ncbi:DUF2155 domain-containing protein [Rhodobacter capsulatus]|uniref:DUF2155 domain-containing protein n=1 Tax=Rhodobacter capsulatus TaxID=1061 RepID=A0A4V5PNT2_RHOCA|nr:DUF2155 domain-containing protein [Rhodobacter capsulatus]TKD14512.1 DUF2155 domain-containing protein [Rhodobacter capsulatus]
MIRAALVAVLLTAGAAVAQEAPEGLAEASGANLRGLDKIAGAATDLSLAVGESVDYGSLSVKLDACRYPADDPASNAYAFLEITDTAIGREVFRGWMIAQNPALSALDHQRYDVWVLRCKID